MTRWLSNHRCHQCNDPVLVEPPMSSEYWPWGGRVVADATDVMVRDVAEPPVPTGSAWVGVRKLPWHKHWVWPLSGTRDRVDNAATNQENLVRIEPGVVRGQ